MLKQIARNKDEQSTAIAKQNFQQPFELTGFFPRKCVDGMTAYDIGNRDRPKVVNVAEKVSGDWRRRRNGLILCSVLSK